MNHITRPDTPHAKGQRHRKQSFSRLARVLIVDDDPSMLTVTRRILGRDHDVVCAIGAPIALSLLRSGGPEFDAVVCALFMAQMSGQELHGAIRGVSPQLADGMIFVSSDLACPKAREFLDTVPNLRLWKPIDFGELRASIRVCWERKPAEA